MALKPMSCKEAITQWEKATGEVAAEAKVVELQFRWPPIEKMDASLSTLAQCEKLSLSTNMIDKISGIAGIRHLKILSLGRNNIKALVGIETVAESLEQLWMSYNPLEKIKGIGSLKMLNTFYVANCAIKEWVEFNRMQECPSLRDVVFIGNPLCETQPDIETYRTLVSNKLSQINKLDGIPIVRDTDE